MNTTLLKSKRVLIPAITVLVLGAGTTAAVATDNVPGNVAGNDDDRLSQTSHDRAADAALKAVASPGAKVVDAEKADRDGDDGADVAYEVEVLKTDGSEVDVKLDAGYRVLATDAGDVDDRDDHNEADEPDDSRFDD